MDNVVDYIREATTTQEHQQSTQERQQQSAQEHLQSTQAHPQATQEVAAQTETPLRETLKKYLENYFNELGTEMPNNIYKNMLKLIELPMLVGIMKYTRNNQSRAAKLLNISRGTLRKKLKLYGLL